MAAVIPKLYKLSHSVTSNKITRQAIWSLWSNVNNWPTWDKGLASCVLTGKFEKGQSFSLSPLGAPKPLTTQLLEATENKSFKDKTIMPLGTIEVTHTIDEVAEGLKVTHTIEASIHSDKVKPFEETLWAKWQKGLPNSVENIVKLAEEMTAKQQADAEPTTKKTRSGHKF